VGRWQLRGGARLALLLRCGCAALESRFVCPIVRRAGVCQGRALFLEGEDAGVATRVLGVGAVQWLRGAISVYILSSMNSSRMSGVFA
jgi:hypothetical protein